MDGVGVRTDCPQEGAFVCGDRLVSGDPDFCTTDCTGDKCCQGTSATPTATTTDTTATTPGQPTEPTPEPKDCPEVCKQTEGRVTLAIIAALVTTANVKIL